jgi:hypothetical protein
MALAILVAIYTTLGLAGQRQGSFGRTTCWEFFFHRMGLSRLGGRCTIDKRKTGSCGNLGGVGNYGSLLDGLGEDRDTRRKDPPV